MTDPLPRKSSPNLHKSQEQPLAKVGSGPVYPVGTPLLLRTMEADLQPLNHGLNSAWRLAQDRERWKQLVEMATLQSGVCPR